MSHSASPAQRLPQIVATGFTTALLGDERTLREFVVGDHVVQEMRARGESAVLYLINDSYDPLNERQLRIGVNKDARLIEQVRPFCGRPIAEIPDPFGCHTSYSEHFAHRLTARLHALDIHPVVIDTYQAYRNGHYSAFIERTFAHYKEIQTALQRDFGYAPHSLFRAQCAQCRSIDTTTITGVGDPVVYRCLRCDIETTTSVRELRGKLNWKLDCAARWNLYGIHTEVFAKPHMEEAGTFNVARAISQGWFGSHVPAVVKYGSLHISGELTGRLMQVLPPAGLKQLLLEPLVRDLFVTRSSLEHFASCYNVRPGTTYAHFVREELPRKALELNADDSRELGARSMDEQRKVDEELVAHANAYSELIHGRRHGLRHPDATVLADAEPELISSACDALHIAIAVRHEEYADDKELKAALKRALNVRPMPGVYAFLRQVFAQQHGPHVTTLLSMLPISYLATVHLLLQSIAATHSAQASTSGDDGHTQRRAA